MKLKALVQNSFLRDVAKLSFGTIGGRMIALAALPILTRLYVPEDFALLAVYLAIVSMVAVAACLRFEIAIPLAETDEDAANLLVLALLAASFVVLTLALIALTIPKTIATLLGAPELVPFIWLIPLGVLLAASYAIFQFWATRARRFGSIAKTRVTQAAIGVGTMLALGWAGLAPVGLLLGNMLSAGSGGIRLASDALRQERDLLRNVDPRRLTQTLKTYRRYPIYSTPEALANIAGIQVPIILIASYAGKEAGFLFLAMQVMTTPMALLGGSISQVYMSRAPEEMRNGRLAEFTFDIMKRLAVIGFVPLILIGLIGPIILPLIFGAEWERTGTIVALLVPWIALQFVASPISTVMYVTGRQHSMLMLTVFGAILKISSVFAVNFFGLDHGMVEAFTLVSAFFYLACIWVFARAAGVKLEKKLLRFLGFAIMYFTIYSLLLVSINFTRVID